MIDALQFKEEASDVAPIAIRPQTLEQLTKHFNSTERPNPNEHAPEKNSPDKVANPSGIQKNEAGVSDLNDGKYLGGQVFEAFSDLAHDGIDKVRRPVVGATIQVLGSADVTTQTAADGSFQIKGVEIEGVLPVVIHAPGYLQRRVELKMNTHSELELVSKNSKHLVEMSISKRFDSTNPILFGSIYGGKKTQTDVAGVKVEVQQESGSLTALTAGEASVYYFDKDNNFSGSAVSTSSNGRFVIVGLNPGTYRINFFSRAGQRLAPHTVALSENEGSVESFSIGEPMFLSGKVK
jgi:hypothetical protein